MQGHEDIIELLNDVLTAELTAINQYFVDAKMFENWGYKVLADKFRDESIDEMKDADALIERILYLDWVPNLQRLNTVRVGETGAAKLHLGLEHEPAVPVPRRGPEPPAPQLRAGGRDGGREAPPRPRAREGRDHPAERRHREVRRARRQRLPEAARAHPRGRGGARRLARGAAHARRAGRRGELPRAAHPRLTARTRPSPTQVAAPPSGRQTGPRARRAGRQRPPATERWGSTMDLVLRGGTVVDGSGA